MAQNKVKDNRAWIGVLPVLLIVAFSGVIPLMTVVNVAVLRLIGLQRTCVLLTRTLLMSLTVWLVRLVIVTCHRF